MGCNCIAPNEHVYSPDGAEKKQKNAKIYMQNIYYNL